MSKNATIHMAKKSGLPVISDIDGENPKVWFDCVGDVTPQIEKFAGFVLQTEIIKQDTELRRLLAEAKIAIEIGLSCDRDIDSSFDDLDRDLVTRIDQMLDTKTSTIEPTVQDVAHGWSVNVDLINSIEKVLTYPAHPQAIEQIILELLRRGLVVTGNSESVITAICNVFRDEIHNAKQVRMTDYVYRLECLLPSVVSFAREAFKELLPKDSTQLIGYVTEIELSNVSSESMPHALVIYPNHDGKVPMQAIYRANKDISVKRDTEQQRFFTEAELDHIAKDPRALRVVADYHDMQATMGEASDWDCTANNVRKAELKALANKLEEEYAKG